MNNRTKELAEQAGITFDSLGASYTSGSLLDFLERFAELILEAERKEAAEHYLKIMRDAVKIEREACAKLCDELDNNQTNQSLLELSDCAEAIRARSTT